MKTCDACTKHQSEMDGRSGEGGLENPFKTFQNSLKTSPTFARFQSPTSVSSRIYGTERAFEPSKGGIPHRKSVSSKICTPMGEKSIETDSARPIS